HKKGWSEAVIGMAGLATFGIGRAFAAGARGEAGFVAQTRLKFFEKVAGQPGRLKDAATTMETAPGVLTRLTGAAYRSHFQKILPGAVEEYGTARAGRWLPSGSNWVASFTHWDLAAPGRELLDLSPRAARMVNAYDWSKAIGLGHDLADVGNEAVEKFDDHLIGGALSEARE